MNCFLNIFRSVMVDFLRRGVLLESAVNIAQILTGDFVASIFIAHFVVVFLWIDRGKESSGSSWVLGDCSWGVELSTQAV
jgi:hypothetical protein